MNGHGFFDSKRKILGWAIGLSVTVIGLSWIVANSVSEVDHWVSPIFSGPAGSDMNASGVAGQWAGALVTLLGFGLVLYQLEQDKKERENHTKELAGQTSWMVYSNGLTTLNVFFAHPHLRQYFYGDNVPVPSGEEKEKVFVAAEMLLDHWESTFFSDDLKDNVNVLWYMYMMGLYGQSPSLQEFLKHENEGYRYCKSFVSVLSNPDCVEKVRQFRKGKLDKRTLEKIICAVVMAAKQNPGA